MATKDKTYLVSNKSWDRYKKTIKNFLNFDSGRQTVIWAKHVNQMLYNGEDDHPVYYKILIEALCYYNAFRNWPINIQSTTGESDEENLSLMISADYIQHLDDGKYWLPHKFFEGDYSGYWDFNWSEDRFVINGMVYKPTGDTQIAQAKDEALLFLIILKRDRDTKLDWISQIEYGFMGKGKIAFAGKDGILFNGKT